MKKPNKPLAWALSLALVLGMTPTPAFAEEALEGTEDVAIEEADAVAAEGVEDDVSEEAEDAVAEEAEAVSVEEPEAVSAEEAEDAAVQEPEVQVEFQDNPAHEGVAVFDKADYYVEAEDANTRSGQQRAYNLTPRKLSAEMKYFAKYESSCNYNQGFSGGDGYHAVGYYQFDVRYGLYDFMMACYEYNPTRYSMFAQFQGWKAAIQSTTGTSVLGQKIETAWHAAYAKAPQNFSNLQDAWAYQQYYLPAYSYLKGRGVDLNNYADCVKGLCWGMSNLFGTGGWRKFVGGTTSGYHWDGTWYNSYDWPGAGLTNSMTDVQFVTTLCGYVTNNVGVFYAAQPDYHYGWETRYMRELMDCLTYLDAKGNLVYEYDDVYPASNASNSTWKWRLRWKKADGTYLKAAWKTVNGKRYRFDKNGNALYDAPNGANMWLVNGKRYLIGKDHSVYMGWKTWPDGTISYLAPKYNGAACKGWWTIGGKKYRFNASFRALRGTWWVDGKRYYFDSKTGAMHTGWLTWSNGSKSYFHPDRDGAACKGRWWIGGKLYHFSSTGIMSTGWMTWSDGTKSYFHPNRDGAACKGWWTIEGKKYYFDSARKALANGWHVINGKKYYFDAQGVYQPNATA